jgi:hypothetical protein
MVNAYDPELGVPPEDVESEDEFVITDCEVTK